MLKNAARTHGAARKHDFDSELKQISDRSSLDDPTQTNFVQHNLTSKPVQPFQIQWNVFGDSDVDELMMVTSFGCWLPTVGIQP